MVATSGASAPACSSWALSWRSLNLQWTRLLSEYSSLQSHLLKCGCIAKEELWCMFAVMGDGWPAFCPHLVLPHLCIRDRSRVNLLISSCT